MSELQDARPENSASRCPSCDSIVPEGATQCLMCGQRLAEAPATSEEPAAAPLPALRPQPDTTPEPLAEAQSLLPEVVESVMRERQAPVVLALTASSR